MTLRFIFVCGFLVLTVILFLIRSYIFFTESIKLEPNKTQSNKILSNKTQLYNLAWSNSNNHSKSEIPNDGKGNIVLLDSDVDENDVAKYKQLGYKVAGYISVGSWENYRVDRANFPDDVFGKDYEAWKGETWFIVSQWKKLIYGMTQRMKMLNKKGFDLVEFDNILFEEGKKSDMIDYANQLSMIAKVNSLIPLLKNGGDLMKINKSLIESFDGFIVEEGLKYNEVDVYEKIKDKPCWFFEYDNDDKKKVKSWMTNVWLDTADGWQKIK